ncbi:MAG: hypothetical protein INR63_31125, partial [Actinomycetospora chiangmaiensis]|nr:hypothetical protein [Actinomycetospora chiangmaiensis]
MIGSAASRLSRLGFLFLALGAGPATAQVFPFSVGFGPLPSFAWPESG